MKKIVFLSVLVLAVTVLFSGCSKDDEAPKGSHKVVFKVIGSENAIISSVVYSNENGDPTSVTGIDANTWTSDELTIPSSAPVVVITAGGDSIDDNDATLTVQILVDGEVKKENTSTGPYLSAQTSYSF